MKTIKVRPEDIPQPELAGNELAGNLDEYMASNSLPVKDKIRYVAYPMNGCIVPTEDGRVYFISEKELKDRFLTADACNEAFRERTARCRKSHE